MDFALSPEQAELQRTVRAFLSEKSDDAAVRRLMEAEVGYDTAVWHQMATQLGLHGLAIAEEHGGAGFGLQEQAIVFEEMGRALLCAPYFATVALAAPALALSDAAAQYLPDIAAGATIATVSTDAATAVQQRADWTLTGELDHVLDGHLADLILVSAGDGLFAVAGDANGVKRELLATMDQTRKQARLTLDSVPARRIGSAAILGQVLDIAVVLLAAEQVGGASACLEQTVEYAKVREQFGRPIGSFQAIKHTWTEMLLEVESARAAAQYAAWAADAAPEELPVAAALAKAHCSEAYARVATESIQLHGGIGFTWEHRTHLYYKRAKSSELLFGAPAAHREQLVTRLAL
ncbi:MAG TPA: acyl-CoA dehydrogenase family protein [Sporichthyaceae bacterium]|jgi:alkylation response protein AidB-like acyl-CoA dehydrogenase